MKKALQRTGAAGLAAATIVTGLSFGPAATAAPQPSPAATTSDAPAAADPSILAAPVITSASLLPDGTATISGRAAPGVELRVTNNPGAGWWTPEAGRYFTPASGVFTLKTKLLVNGQAVVRGFGASGTGESNRVTPVKVFVATWAASTNTVTLVIRGGEPNANVYITDANGNHSNGGGGRTDANGMAQIALTPEAAAGTSIRVKFGQSGTWYTVPTGRAAAVSDLRVERGADGRFIVRGRATLELSQDILISADSTGPVSVQTHPANADGTFAFALNDAASRLKTAYVYNGLIGVRTPITIPRTSPLTAQIANIDHVTRTVTVTGTATPGATITANNTYQTYAAADGRYSFDVRLWQDGPFTIVLRQRVGDALIDSKELTGTIQAGDFGTVTPVLMDPVELVAGEQSDVSFAVTKGTSGGLTSDVRLTAPAGTTFPANATLEASWRAGTSGAWSRVPSMDITNGRLSAQNTVLTASKDHGTRGAGQYRWTVKVATPATMGATPGLSLGYETSGTTSGTQYRASGNSPVTIKEAVTAADLTLTSHRDGDTFDPTQATTLQGTATPGAEVTAYWFGKDFPDLATKTTAAADGSYALSRELRGTNDYDIVLTQTAQTGKINEVSVRLNAPRSAAADLTVTSPGNGSTFDPATPTIIRGKATPGATVTAYWFGTNYPDLATETTASPAGDYILSRGLGGVNPYNIVLTQTTQPGKINEVTLRLNAPVPAIADLTLTSPSDGDTFDPAKATTLRGKATPGATVTAYWFGKNHPDLATSVTANASGDYALSRGLGGVNPYNIVLTQTPQAGKINELTLRLNAPVPAIADLTLTSHTDGDTFATGTPTTLRGKATPGATITAYWFGKNYPQYATEVTVGTDGSYAISRGLGGPNPYTIVLTQTEQPGKINEVSVRLNPAPTP